MGHYLISCEYKNNSSIFYLGYKNPSLNLVVPVFIIKNPLPIVVAGLGYILGYFWRKKSKAII
jgi:hypothetical protein